MIRILATALLALSLPASGAFATSLGELVYTDGIYCKKFTDVPFTGKVNEGWARGAFKNGKREGPWDGYYTNGQLEYKGECKNGEPEEPWVVYLLDDTKSEGLTGTYPATARRCPTNAPSLPIRQRPPALRMTCADTPPNRLPLHFSVSDGYEVGIVGLAVHLGARIDLGRPSSRVR
jgi:hypothetical protein